MTSLKLFIFLLYWFNCEFKPFRVTRDGVTDETLLDNGIYRPPATVLFSAYRFNMPGFVIPYHDLDGNPILDRGLPYARLRLDEPLGKMKYFQHEGSAPHIYIPKGLAALKGDYLVVVEGEIKALALVEAGIPAIGIGGFYGFATEKGKVIIPELAELLKSRRPNRVYFLGDSDTSHNYQFADAAVKMARLISPTAVLLPRIPVDEQKGIDDVRDALASGFLPFWQAIVDAAMAVPPNQIVKHLCLDLLEREVEKIAQFSPASREALARRMAALGACMSRDFMGRYYHLITRAGYTRGAMEHAIAAIRDGWKNQNGMEPSGSTTTPMLPMMSAGTPSPSPTTNPNPLHAQAVPVVTAAGAAAAAPAESPNGPQPPPVGDSTANGSTPPPTGESSSTTGSATPPPVDERMAKLLARCTSYTIPGILAIKDNPDDSVLGDYYLERGSGGYLVGPAGTGKSSWLAQAHADWGRGKESFGIKPNRALKILVFQAENSPHDLKKLFTGIVNGLGITPEEAEALREMVEYVSVAGLLGDDFLDLMEYRLSYGGWDLVCIDPLLAFMGADPMNIKETAHFLRERFDAMIKTYRVAALITHHTTKITNRDSSAWGRFEHAYSGAGNADMSSNYPRFVLSVNPVRGHEGLFQIFAAKRSPWTDPTTGQRVYDRYFRHASAPGAIHWEEASAPPPAAKFARPTKSADDIIPLVPMSPESIEVKELVAKAKAVGFGRDAAWKAITLLHKTHAIIRHEVPRTTGPAEVRYCRPDDTTPPEEVIPDQE